MSGERNDLSRSARALIDAARDADAPTRGDRERVRRALAVAIAAGAGTAGATVSAAAGAKAIASSAATSVTGAGTTVAAGSAATGAAATAATAGLFTKVAIAVVAIGVGSSAIVAVNHYQSAPSTSGRPEIVVVAAPAAIAPARTHAVDHVREPPVVAASTDTATATETAPAEPTAIPEPVAPAPVVASAPASVRRPRAATSAPIAADADEAATVDLENAALRDAIAHGPSPERRLASVDRHATEFPEGQLAFARERARRRAVDDLCAEGPDAVARFLAAHPASSSAPLIRATCPAAR